MTRDGDRARVRVYLGIDAEELPDAYAAADSAIRSMRLQPVDEVADADVFVGVYGDRYAAIEPRIGLSRLELDYLAAGSRPRLVYVLPGSARREPHLKLLLSRIQADDLTSYRRVSDARELAALLTDDVAVLLTEAFTDREQAAAPDDRPTPAARHARARVPAAWHRLVGRQREVSEVCQLLSDGTRLLTVTGPGGIGKSRLAIEVATLVESEVPDGAWFVDLAAIRDPALVPPTIAQVLGIRESAGVAPLESLKSYLAGKRLILLLDSFETVVPAGPMVADLLTAASGLTVLVTSRIVLRIRGEQEYPLRPLDVPAGDPVDGHRPSPALELFLERAVAANPNRRLDDVELRAAADICCRLDGVPLALELAAARTRLLSPTVLLDRLGHALDELNGGPLDHPTRQRTLRTTIDWDHDLLGLEEQTLFRRLAVFPRQFTLTAAEAVVGEAGLDVVDLVDDLAGKSLLRAYAPDVRDEPVFGMLQAVHDYAVERLEASGEAEELRRRHAEYVLGRAERAGTAPPSEADRWLATLEAEHADIRAALHWADSSVEADLLLRLAAALGTFWRSHCHFSEGRRWLDRALGLSAGQRNRTRVDLLNAAGFLSRARGDYETAEQQYREALSIREELGDPAAIAGSMRFLGNVAYDRGDLDAAEEWWRRSLAALEGTRDVGRRMSVLNNLGIVAHLRGDDREAIRLYDQTNDLAVSIGAAEVSARAQMNKAQALSRLGELVEAQRVGRAAVRIYAGLDDTWDLVDAVDVLAAAVGRAGSAELSGWLFGGASALRSALDVKRPVSEQADYDESVEESRRVDAAAFDAAFRDGAAASLHDIVQRALQQEVTV